MFAHRNLIMLQDFCFSSAGDSHVITCWWRIELLSVSWIVPVKSTVAEWNWFQRTRSTIFCETERPQTYPDLRADDLASKKISWWLCWYSYQSGCRKRFRKGFENECDQSLRKEQETAISGQLVFPLPSSARGWTLFTEQPGIVSFF